VGTIPPVLDAVMVGPASAMRCQRAKHLIVLGALEGAMPGYGGTGGVLTDQERTLLREMGVPLSGGSMAGIQTEFAEIYGVFCGARETVRISCPAGQPSFIYRRLLDMAGTQTQYGQLLGAALTDATEAGAFLARFDASDAAGQLGISEEYQQVCAKRDHALGDVSPQNIQKLYGKSLQLSASQIDKQAQCRLSYFLKYGIYARERKAAEVDPAEFGTYVHAVLEKTVQQVMSLGGFRVVSAEQTTQIAREHSRQYAADKFSQLDSQRMEYLFRRNIMELDMIVAELWNELHESDFLPVDCELYFGQGGKMPGVSITGQTMDAMLRGFVDRVDAWQAEG
jgi:ATP-dependent helicase/nuclease subunit B